MSIRQQVKKGVEAAFRAAGDTVVLIELRLGPKEDDYDPEADTSSRSWEQISQVQAIPYNDKNFRRGTVGQPADRETKTRSYIVKGSAVNAPNPTQEGEVVEQPKGTVWQIAEMSIDPAAGVWLIHCTS